MLLHGKTTFLILHHHTMKNKPYPIWICRDCGKKHTTKGQFEVSTWHIDTCNVCGEEKECTEPRDFYYPNFPGHDRA